VLFHAGGRNPAGGSRRETAGAIAFLDDMRGAANLKTPVEGILNIDDAALAKVLRFIRLTGVCLP
jgi:hypothetical protein